MFSDTELIDVIERADVHHYERPVQVQGWLRRKQIILEYLNDVFVEHCGVFETGLLSTIVSYLTPEHFHYAWRPQMQMVDRTSAAAMNHTASKFGGDHPFLLEGEEQGVRCKNNSPMDFLMQLLDEDLPEAIRGDYVPDELRLPGKRAMLQLWICRAGSWKCGSLICGEVIPDPRWIDCCSLMRGEVIPGARWIDCSGASIDSVLDPPRPIDSWLELKQRYVLRNTRGYSECGATDIPLLRNWTESQYDSAHIDEEWYYEDEMSAHPERFIDPEFYDDTDENCFDKLSGFGDWPNPITIERCSKCQSFYEPLFQLGSYGVSWSERYLHEALFLYSCPKHRDQLHYQIQGT